MFRRSNVTLRAGWPAFVIVALAGCQFGPSPEVQQKLAQLEAVSAQRDTLVQQIADHARLMSDISAQLAQVQIEGKELVVRAESPLQATRDSVLERLNYIVTRVDETDAQLQASRRRIRELTNLSDSLRTTLEVTIANYESVIESQRITIAALTEEVTNLQAENAVLAEEKAELEAETNTAYYVIGTKDELLERGIVKKEGGARFLFIFGRRGEMLVPARDLEPSLFTAIDRHDVTEIELPDQGKDYKIASRQDLTQLETPPDEKGKIRGSLRIASPDEFWSTSKFLIIVQG